MALRFRLAPEKTNINFFKYQWITFGGSMMLTVVAILLWAVMGLNFGIDFRGGTTIRTEAAEPVDVGAYRDALRDLDLGDVAITEVFDPSFADNQFVAQVRIAPEDGVEAVTPETILAVEEALKTVAPSITFPSVESVGPKVSGELIWKAITAMVGGVIALVHDIFITIGVFALFQLKFDLTIIAALLTILGYSINDTVVVFDRLRENLLKYKTMPLRDVMNLSVNETLSRTLMTSVTTLVALAAMLIFGGDVIRGFAFAIFFGVVLGTYSSIFVAKNIVLIIGLDRGDKPKNTDKNEFANVDA
jgi:preprotein translocase subunit SecF